MLMIRHFEQALLDLFARGEIAGTVHTCVGQEYVPVALAPFIATDFIFSNHRGHGHFLAMHDDPATLLAEIMGRDGAVCHGVGGSQHVYLEDRFLTTGVQGESLPAAVGMALHMRHAQPGRLAVAFIGDGTFGEGAVYEALNMAQLWHVPLLVVVENNGIAQSTPTEVQMAGTVAGRAGAFGIAYRGIEGDDVTAIRSTVEPLIADARRSSMPLVLEFDTIRLGPHSKGDDSRSPETVAALRTRDWAERYSRRFPEQFAEVNEAQRTRIARVVQEIRHRPLSVWNGAP